MRTPYEPFSEETKKRESSCSCRRIFCWVCGILTLIIVLLGIMALVLYLVFDPKKPTVSVTSLSLEYMNLTQTDGNTSLPELFSRATTNSSVPLVTVFAALNLTFKVVNPNRLTLKLDPIQLSTFYSNASLANTTIASFSIGHDEEKLVPSQIVIAAPLSTSLVKKFIEDFLASSVALQTNVVTRGRIRILGITSPRVRVRVLCDSTVDVRSQSIASNSCRLREVSL